MLPVSTCQVYQHHCINSLGEHARRLRNAAVYMVEHQQNVTWALELWGFKDVAFKVGLVLTPASKCAQAQGDCLAVVSELDYHSF